MFLSQYTIYILTFLNLLKSTSDKHRQMLLSLNYNRVIIEILNGQCDICEYWLINSYRSFVP